MRAVRFLKNYTSMSVAFDDHGNSSGNGPEREFKQGEVLVVDDIHKMAEDLEEPDDDHPATMADLITPLRSYVVPLDCFIEVALVQSHAIVPALPPLQQTFVERLTRPGCELDPDSTEEADCALAWFRLCRNCMSLGHGTQFSSWGEVFAKLPAITLLCDFHGLAELMDAYWDVTHPNLQSGLLELFQQFLDTAQWPEIEPNVEE